MNQRLDVAAFAAGENGTQQVWHHDCWLRHQSHGLTAAVEDAARRDERMRIADLITSEGPWCVECSTYEFAVNLAREGSAADTVYKITGWESSDDFAYRRGMQDEREAILGIMLDLAREYEGEGNALEPMVRVAMERVGRRGPVPSSEGGEPLKRALPRRPRRRGWRDRFRDAPPAPSSD